MTFTECGEVVGMEKSKKIKKTIGQLLRECLGQAMDHQRLTSGVFECAKLLHCNPENVMMCVLPEASSENISIHIQHTLIEAFCWENDIRILKVKNVLKFDKTFLSFKDDAEPSCMLVQYPKGCISHEEELIADFYDEMMASDIYPKPVIELPV